MTAAQMLLTKTAQFSTARKMLGQKPEALEYSTVAEAHRVIDELLVIAIVASQIGCEAVGYMLDATADCRVVEHVDNRTVRVGNGHSSLMAPDILRAEDLPLIDVLQRKECSVPLLTFLTHGLCGHQEDILEDLFGQVPVLGCCAASDVGWCEECGNEHPWVIEDAI